MCFLATKRVEKMDSNLLRSGDLTIPEQDDFIRAVLCLQSLPSTVNRTQFPGARTRYDDFVIVHANYTPNIHMTACSYYMG